MSDAAAFDLHRVDTPLIDDPLIDAVMARITADGVGEGAVMGLRKAWPDIHFTYCLDDDIWALEPYREARGFNIYLVTGRYHCLSFTGDIGDATGLVIASLDDGGGA
ncbi:MAG: hypothetical protein KDE22_04515 [Rhodobacterales bacterium]|nr:hypothetical protein [Rhodobacterales bacterium]